MRLLDGSEPVERQDVLVADARDRHRARADGIAVDDDRAGTALGQAAAEAGAVLVQVVAQDVEQRRRRIGVHDTRGAVHSH